MTIESAPPAEPPISVSKRLAMTRNSLIASWLKRARARPSAGSVKSTPSTMMVAWLALPRRADDRSVADEAVAAALALHARREEGQPLEVAVGDRQLLDLLGHDVGRRVGLVDVHERPVATTLTVSATCATFSVTASVRSDPRGW